MQALAQYGYVMGEDGVLRSPLRPRSQWWKPVEGGFLRFDGSETVPVPFTLKPDFRGVSGLDFRKNPLCYEWIWPEIEIAKIYTIAKAEEEANRRPDKDVVVVEREPEATPEEIVTMVEAQAAAVEQPKRRWFR